MKKLAVAVAVMMAAGTANAGFYCSVVNSQCTEANKDANMCQQWTGSNYANNKHLEWHWGQAFPDTTPFNYEQSDVVCFVDGGILYNVITLVNGLKKIPLLMNGPTQGPGSGAKTGIVYRGDEARFLIDNLRSIPFEFNGIANVATPVTRTEFFNNFQP